VVIHNAGIGGGQPAPALTEDELERISGPSGLDIGADSPAETALSMLAEALAVRAGRKGGLLRDSPHRIHAEAAAGKK
jgi:xanthine dehydrogenase accessory factor